MSWRSTIKDVNESPKGWRSTIVDEGAPQEKSVSDRLMGFLAEAPIAPGLSAKRAAEMAMGGLQKIGEAVDPYTGAPVRSGIMAGIKGESPVAAALGAVGRPSSESPAGKDIVRELGVPDTSLSDVLPSLYSESGKGLALEKGGLLDPSASGAAGLGVDVLADWTNVVPFGAVAKAVRPVSRAQDLISASPRASGLIEGGKDAAKTFTGAVSRVTSPKQAATFPAAVEVAQKYGVDPKLLPPSVEFGPESFISRASRGVAEGPAGESLLQAYKSADEAVAKAIDASVSKAAKGKPLDLVSGGEAIKDGFDAAKDALLSGADITYDKIQKYAPGLYLDREAADKLASKLAGVEKYAKGLVARSHPQFRAQGKYLLDEIAQIRRGKGTFKQVVEQMKELGQVTFGAKYQPNVIRPDIAKNKEIYFAMRDAIVDTARKHISPEMADELVSNNAKISDFLKNSAEFEKFLDLPAEKIVPAIAADTKRLEAFKKTVSPDTLAQLKGAYVQDIIPKNAQGEVMFGSLAKAIQKDESVLKALLEPGEFSALKELAQLGASFGPPILSSSGTGASVGFMKMLRGIMDSTVTKKTIDAMKARARGAGPALPPKAPKATKAAPGAALPDGPGPGLLPRMLGKRKGLIGQTVKGAQSATPSGLLESDNEQ